MVELGFNYIAPARIGQNVDRAYRQLCAARNWPFLELEVTAAPPMELELGKVLSVKCADGSQPRGVDRRWLVSNYPDLTETGTAQFWYLEDKTLKTYPVDDSELSVRIKRRPVALGENDEPLIPEEWQYILVDMAVIPCLKDDDEREEARSLRAEVQESIREMTDDLLGRNLQNPQTVKRTGEPGDYL